MAVNLKIPKKVFAIEGIGIGVTEAGIKKENRKDLTIFKLDEGTTLSGVFTKNLFCAAPVQIAKKHLLSGKPVRSLVINTGNANAGTGQKGLKDAQKICNCLGSLLKIEDCQVLPFSTGVVLEPLPVEKIVNNLDKAILKIDKNNWMDAAYGIMTTDTTPKIFSEQFIIGERTFTITGISKGAGMIHPNMATMLGFIGTDLGIKQQLLDKIIKDIADQSFNRITIDGDTSTNDSFIIMATGKSNIQINSENDSNYNTVLDALSKAASDLSQKIVRDAEGATKFITLQVEQAASKEEALSIAYSVAKSPLVKTAFYASDPNIGRILVAIGYSNTNIPINKIKIWLNDLLIVENGELSESYTEESGKKIMEQQEITIKISLNNGYFSEKVYTCDLSHDYITINADYRS
ncbi:glutamate N-acetyltransferase/amino-acid N-acetyltransferase [Candidatus Kinetoplastibacterium blastocrithidii TCC012E]|uniref:Arginine biosynthesis bifunctional protein ArgJ n=1 Tax=Candidatus Kinetoplastidibacterium blastocrithidiae TCC012E TaxID=1208922 RepID=M1M2U7_9PROT|nr:bifunctional glutamate N-acetyltransferase/amino-acid acetyltransferase ArgJ [Candidatus Kinetoplastibacterium blastocrithidii]AFZ83423.1 bifunctional ornithine acetyltransferase/N-acetylglutamate synthase protein [Candidatus Kinetoplastibacterium blastocrithidii (ex Strigomonas culicis)]AGF49519.1 glutamate N-acetyltransferase/amino-acid N-acetyltransferase [Candidatus Kinetoplastibacterium blastocrithidii TCC012E]